MKRRGFFALVGKIAGAWAATPVVAKTMDNLNALDTPVLPAPPEVPKALPKITEPFTGQIRYNTFEKELELYHGNRCVTIAYQGEPRGTGGEAVYDPVRNRTVHTFKESGTFKA